MHRGIGNVRVFLEYSAETYLAIIAYSNLVLTIAFLWSYWNAIYTL